jgi:hypothetical protein
VELYRRALGGDHEARRALNRFFDRRPWMCEIVGATDSGAPPPNRKWDAATAAAIRRQHDAAVADAS